MEEETSAGGIAPFSLKTKKHHIFSLHKGQIILRDENKILFFNNLTTKRVHQYVLM